VRTTWCAALVTLIFCIADAELGAQAEVRRTQLLFGPRLGLTAVIVQPSEFNDEMQAEFPSSDKTYYPFFTQMGIEAQQLVPIGETSHSFAVHEVFLLGGLDQGMAIPSANLVLGFHSSWGVELGLGPFITVLAPGGRVRLAAGVVYILGYTLPLKGFSLPITFTMVPIPSYSNPRLSLITGINFASLE
jgi:hypothetical protein